MKAIPVTAIILAFALGAYSQRKGLDQLDLLPTPRATSPSTSEPPALDPSNQPLDGSHWGLVRPLSEYSIKLEADFRADVIDDKSTAGRNAKLQKYADRLKGIFHGLFGVIPSPADPRGGGTTTLADLATTNLEQSVLLEQCGALAGNASDVIQYPDSAQEEFAWLKRNFGMTSASDTRRNRELLVAAILRRINENFAKLRPLGQSR